MAHVLKSAPLLSPYIPSPLTPPHTPRANLNHSPPPPHAPSPHAPLDPLSTAAIAGRFRPAPTPSRADAPRPVSPRPSLQIYRHRPGLPPPHASPSATPSSPACLYSGRLPLPCFACPVRASSP